MSFIVTDFLYYCRVFLSFVLIALSLVFFTSCKKNLSYSKKNGIVPASVKKRTSSIYASKKEVPRIYASEKVTLLENKLTSIKQPTVPSKFKEIPFLEEAPKLTFNKIEKEFGYILFKRPIIEPVYPNTRPLASERLKELSGFATKGEYESLTFSVYPNRALKNFHVELSDLKSNNGIIPKSNIDIRLATYWNIRYPSYTSNSTYRRQPELLEKITAHSSPARECQRWWLNISVPENIAAGIYSGTAKVWDDFNQKALTIPIKFKVLDFKLTSDPTKHYSTYYRIRTPLLYKGKNKKETQEMLNNEYKSMVSLGLNTLPVLFLGWDRGKEKIVLWGGDQVKHMMAAGLKGPFPVTGDCAIQDIYLNSTPGGKLGSHWNISKMPPPKFYKKVEEEFKKFAKECRDKNWPEMYCGVLDEVTAGRSKFGSKVYQAVKKAGWKTYITKDPNGADASLYKNYVDVWCSQPYSVPYEDSSKQKRYQYWSYPNHIAGEIKNAKSMSKGGRMTYGYGFWRSGYKTLVPWHWGWVMKPDQFDYLRSKQAGCGQRFDSKGNVIPTTYWNCFREGIDDARYVYTLQQAIWERENSINSVCLKLVAKAKASLQKLWNDINVQKEYTSSGMWASNDFNARRWELALHITTLLKYPAIRQGDAPSVIVNSINRKKVDLKELTLEREIKSGNIEVKDLSNLFFEWKSRDDECDIDVTKKAGIDGKKGLQWKLAVDYNDGEDGYPVGWPKIFLDLKNSSIDFSKYDYLKYMIRIDSDRDEVSDDATLLGFTFQSNKFCQFVKDLGGSQRVWLPLIFNIHDLIARNGNLEQWKKISMMQLFISEKNYKDKVKLKFDIGAMQLLRFKKPIIVDVSAPAMVLLPEDNLAIQYEMMGKVDENKNYKIDIELKSKRGELLLSNRASINSIKTINLNITNIDLGIYDLVIKLVVDEKVCSKVLKEINFIKGPFYE